MAEYQITTIQPMVDIDERGRFFKKYRVSFKFDNIEDFVDVREEEFKADNVKKLIEARIAEFKKLKG